MRFLFFISLLLIEITTGKTQAAEKSHLNWCRLLDSSAQQIPPLAAPLKRVLTVAEASLKEDFPAVKALHLEGTLDSDPGHQESKKAVNDLPKLIDLAVCARTAALPLRENCKEKAMNAILKWTRTYLPTGNPIDENRLIPILKAADLLSPLMEPSQRTEIFSFFKKMASQGDAFYKKMKPTDGRIANNWGTWRLTIRSLIGTVTNDETLRADTAKLWRTHIAKNIKSDGSTLDFSQRDALDYQLYDLEAYSEAIAQTPGLIADTAEKKSIASAFQFLRPYYVGEKQHTEFLHTSVAFDTKRKEAGMPAFQNVAWKPETARKVLRLARPFVPEIRNWSENVVDDRYDPSLKLLTAACGESTALKISNKPRRP